MHNKAINYMPTASDAEKRRRLLRRYDSVNMKKTISFIILYFISNASIAGEAIECEWSPIEKATAWEVIKSSLREKDPIADDFYDLNLESNSLQFWVEDGKCQFIPSLNMNSKNDYLDGGVVVYLNMETQQVLEVVEIAW